MTKKNDNESWIPNPFKGSGDNPAQEGGYMKGGNFEGDTSKDRKYYDEGKDGDYNTPGMDDTGSAEGDENYADEDELNQASPDDNNRKDNPNSTPDPNI